LNCITIPTRFSLGAYGSLWAPNVETRGSPPAWDLRGMMTLQSVALGSWAHISLNNVEQKTEKTEKRETSKFIFSPKTM
jgi:hypothetical protein